MSTKQAKNGTSYGDLAQSRSLLKQFYNLKFACTMIVP